VIIPIKAVPTVRWAIGKPSSTAGTTNYSRNSLNQYTAVGGVNYSYDKNGNLTNDGQYRYYYDCENRLTDVNDVNDSRVASYRYDYLGRRIRKTEYSSQKTTRYVYDGEQIVAEFDVNSVTQVQTLRRRFFYGPGIDEPICMLIAANSAKFYYHYDGLGSVVAISNNSGKIVERYSYDVFGEPTIRDSGDVTRDSSAYGNRFMFTGRDYDDETGLYYYRARYYSPAIGRFLSADMLGTVPDGGYRNQFAATTQYEDGMNLYTYVGNNPVMKTDPMGLIVLKCPSNESGAKSDRGLCDDSKNWHPAHWGHRCYREVVPLGTKGQPAGLHCCYKGGKLVDKHIDSISPATSGGGGKCKFDDPCRTAKHGLWDVWLIPGGEGIPNSMPILAF